jgi:hypothetical protein
VPQVATARSSRAAAAGSSSSTSNQWDDFEVLSQGVLQEVSLCLLYTATPLARTMQAQAHVHTRMLGAHIYEFMQDLRSSQRGL